MDIKKIADLAENFERGSFDFEPMFTDRFERLMKAPSKELVVHTSAKHILESELETLLDSAHKSPIVHNLVRLIKAALSMWAWAERSRSNKYRGEELAAMEAATSAMDAVKKAYMEMKGA